MKISKIISGIAAGVFAAFCMTFTAFAEPQDFEPSVQEQFRQTVLGVSPLHIPMRK